MTGATSTTGARIGAADVAVTGTGTSTGVDTGTATGVVDTSPFAAKIAMAAL